MTPLPPASLWEQFSVIGVLALILILIGVVGRNLLRDFIVWQEQQDKKRDDEREKQRVWQEKMEQKTETERMERDKTWQVFFERMNSESRESIDRLAEVHAELVKRMDALTQLVTEHDDWAHRVSGDLPVKSARRPK